MSDHKKLRNLVAPPLSGERKENAVKYRKCVAKYAKGTYHDQFGWVPTCERDCEKCAYQMSRADYIRAMTDVVLRQ